MGTLRKTMAPKTSACNTLAMMPIMASEKITIKNSAVPVP